MTDNIDIVAQLREGGFITHIGGLPRESKLLHEAADEIERLRKELEESEKLLDEYQREAVDRTRWENTNE